MNKITFLFFILFFLSPFFLTQPSFTTTPPGTIIPSFSKNSKFSGQLASEDFSPKRAKNERILIKGNPYNNTNFSPFSSVLTLNEEDLEHFGAMNIGKIIQELTGIFTLSQSGSRQRTTLFLRGGSPSHLDVFIDGVKVNDASSPGGSFDFGNLSLSHIEKIEILKGSQSALIYSHSIMGAINIITKKKGEKLNQIKISGGSFSTIQTEVSRSESFDQFYYSLRVHHNLSKGWSTADERNHNTEKDGYKEIAFFSNVGWKSLRSVETGWSFYFSDVETELDDFKKGILIDDLNYKSNTKSFLNKAFLRYTLGSFWNQEFTFNWNQILKKYNNPNDNLISKKEESLSLLKNEFQGDRFTFYLINSLYPSDSLIFNLVFQMEKEGLKHKDFIKQKENKFSLMEKNFSIQGIYKKEIFFLNVSLKFQPFLTHKIGAGLNLKSIGTVQMSYGTGFKNPSLYQKHSPFINESLDNKSNRKNPSYERSREWSISFIKRFKTINFETTYFHWLYKNKLEYQFQTQSYFNNGDQEGKGVEINLKKELSQKILSSFAFHFLDVRDKDTRKSLKLRPRFSWVAHMRYKIFKDLNARLNFLYVGKRVFLETKLPSYFLLNLSSKYQLKENVFLFFRAENLTDKKYQEIPFYGTPGRSFYLGIQMKI